MFDIGFAELVLLAIVGLLVIGPERLPETVRTLSAWTSRLRRGFNELKMEVQQELHNDEVMRDLRQTGQQLRQEGERLGQDLRRAGSGEPGDSREQQAQAEQKEQQAQQEPQAQEEGEPATRDRTDS